MNGFSSTDYIPGESLEGILTEDCFRNNTFTETGFYLKSRALFHVSHHYSRISKSRFIAVLGYNQNSS